ncbi:hypothetical protein SAMN04488498_15510 [Mesorhizobium albiziae]|uniref:Uncharacterized protein n=1 Tax=Neomesorhizobium albiziae TaxID=335020 RepID=A0A1I4FTF7_9HYPH|nr:hypothetical protein SAMN04488498_15510 [Mesorhizobium albiziae]
MNSSSSRSENRNQGDASIEDQRFCCNDRVGAQGGVARQHCASEELLGRSEPILITGGRAVVDYRDGADMVLIDSKKKDPSEIESFARAWKHDVPPHRYKRRRPERPWGHRFGRRSLPPAGHEKDQGERKASPSVARYLRDTPHIQRGVSIAKATARTTPNVARDLTSSPFPRWLLSCGRYRSPERMAGSYLIILPGSAKMLSHMRKIISNYSMYVIRM